MPNGKTTVKTTAVPKSHKEVELKSVTFSELWNNYAHGNPYDDPNGHYQNQCAIRMSVTLHNVGIEMKSFSQKRVGPMPGKPTLGRLLINGKSTATRAYEFAEWLKLRPIAGVLAPENITGRDWASKVANRTGIVFFDGYWFQDGDSPDNLSGGHIDLWNGSRLTGFASGIRISWNIVIEGFWSDFRNSKTILFFPVK
ncbi:type VI secretion system amidase effector protein Tae4 [Burkholderia arboris]|uniref:Type VI secretion system amidase effector protein Tae4 n=1 Tax=Burkholderia arboris TaxID=488730 RepID=A0ABZ3DSA9_9BURK